MSLKNKRILITAGPTWVRIDKVRVISNIATGTTGILLAEKFLQLGAKVTLLLGPAQMCCLNKNIRIIRFQFFEELKRKIIRELKSKKYDIVIHSAAVADFKPSVTYKRKISSGKNLILRLEATSKIYQDIKRIAPKIKLVIFKLEPGVKENVLLNEAKKSIAQASADLVVANALTEKSYKAFVMNKEAEVLAWAKNKKDLAKKLIQILEN